MCLGGSSNNPTPQQLTPPMTYTRTQEDTARDNAQDVKDRQMRMKKQQTAGSLLTDETENQTLLTASAGY